MVEPKLSCYLILFDLAINDPDSRMIYYQLTLSRPLLQWQKLQQEQVHLLLQVQNPSEIVVSQEQSLRRRLRCPYFFVCTCLQITM